MTLLLGAAVAVAAPAAAIDDPTRPDARVTHGPSCRPGGLAVEVVAGTLPYFVRLATTRTPGGEDEAELQPGQSVVLSTDDVAPGETIDARLEYRARDGSGTSSVDELEDWTLTRPTEEDCAAVVSPPPPAPTPSAPTSPAPSAPTTSAPGTTTPPRPTAEPSRPAPSTAPTPAPTGRPTAPGETPVPSAAPRPTAERVAPGAAVTVRVAGFEPGERVTIGLAGSDVVIGEATAAADGSVTAEVLIPEQADLGPAALAVVGDRSAAVADVPLEVAARTEEVASGAVGLVPLVAAAGALVVTAGVLVPVADRSRRQRRSGRA
ncbi:hypothetical protein [Blastococcus sp. TF02A-30]|uniref:hypothetical protein n=1 Tax=Blastococcus sp. TF02A-30 TaxID=2250580 RepID=UPI0011BFC4FF|nr:hypothetical protein [Blastococcus sp. TF02A-30]